MKILKDRGIYHINVYGSGRTGKGTPDLIACVDGRFVAFELKVEGNDLSDAQKIRKIQIERSGGLHYVPRTVEEFRAILEEIDK
jgi:Holliday junction resolvase